MESTTATSLPTTSGTGTLPAVAARALVKTYGTGEATVHALDGVDVDFERARFTAIMGPSGSGKSTLMHSWARSTRRPAGRTCLTARTSAA